MSQDDLILMAEAVVAAFAAAAVVLLLCGWPWRASRPALVSAGVVIGIGFGFYAGWKLLLPPPRWPPRDAPDRFLVILFPAVLTVELVAAFVRQHRLVVWLMRFVVAAAAGRVLLHNSTYLSDLTGPGSAEWSPEGEALRLGCMAAALAGVWILLDRLLAREKGRAVPLALSLTCGGAALVAMLSGYAGGMLVLPLGAALAGVTAASFALPRGTDLRGAIGPGLVGLFAVLLIGHFFSSLSISHAALLFAAPLACWIPELPPAGKARPWIRGLARVVLVAVPLTVALVQARNKFIEDSRPSAGSGEPSADDYSNFPP